MSYLTAFLIIWIIAPGPIAALTLNRTRSQGVAAGLAVAAGASATTGLILVFVVIVHQLNLSIVRLSTSHVPKILSAVLIIVLGIHAGYKALKTTGQPDAAQPSASKQRNNLLQGMFIALSGIPQSMIFYLILIPQAASASQMGNVIVAFGLTKIALTFLWYAAIAIAISYVQHWLQNPKVSRRFDFATAVLMVGVGVQILV